MEKGQKKQRIFSGIVTSNAMDKTIVVNVERQIAHPLYGKRMSVSKKFKVHDPENKYEVGDTVSFVETRPLSKDKRWIVVA